MNHETIFVSTSIPYVNGDPHVGFAWELIIADTLARYHRQRGRRVFFLTGTDDNSLKNVQAAERAGRDTRSFVHDQGDRFVALGRALQISNDDFIRTGFDVRHAPAVDKLWRACAARGDVYQKSYRGSYCTGCEQFYGRSELPDERCPEHDSVLESVVEQNHFFRLERAASYLGQALDAGLPRIIPEAYLPEALRLVAAGLVDFSVSRPSERARGWGIPVPDDPSQTVYVWFDALANYISALGYGTSQPGFDEHWRDADRRIHVIGKNVTRFHCIYWPAILHSAGLPAPTDVVVHGFLTVNGRKIGKSLGNGVDPFDLIQRFGSDRLRYYLLRHFPLDRDGDFSEAALVTSANASLADQLGNLLNRILALIEKHAGGRVPELPEESSELEQRALAVTRQVAAELEQCAPDRALAAILAYVERCNLYVSRTEPWRLARQGLHEELRRVLGHTARALLWTGALISPFLPEAALGIARATSSPLPDIYASEPPAWHQLAAAARVQRGSVLFPRLEV